MHPIPSKKIIAAGVIGNILEWYDFTLYGYFAPIIAKLFFPMDNKTLSLLATFGVFAIGFLTRPLGAILFGHFGDRTGRKKILAIAVMLMAIPTALIGLLPTYAQIGGIASILLITCRLVQGLALGGEYSGSIVYITEHAPTARRGLYGSWAILGAIAGLILGSAVSALISNLVAPDALHNWAWRIPFVMGFILGIVGLYLRLRMPETPHFLELQTQLQILKNPVRHAFRNASFNMLVAMGLVFLPAICLYVVFMYMSSYMSSFLKMPLQTALLINTLAMLTILICLPFAGMLSDKVGRKPLLIAGGLGFIIFPYPLFLFLQHGTALALLLVQMSFAVLVCLICAPLPAALVELFDTDIRYSAIAFPHNFSNTLFGGTAPLIVTYLIAKTGSNLAPSYYLIFAGLITLISALVIKESHGKKLV